MSLILAFLLGGAVALSLVWLYAALSVSKRADARAIELVEAYTWPVVVHPHVPCFMRDCADNVSDLCRRESTCSKWRPVLEEART